MASNYSARTATMMAATPTIIGEELNTPAPFVEAPEAPADEEAAAAAEPVAEAAETAEEEVVFVAELAAAATS